MGIENIVENLIKRGCREWSPTDEILNIDIILKAITECIKNDDCGGALESIKIYISALIRKYEGDMLTHDIVLLESFLSKRKDIYLSTIVEIFRIGGKYVKR